MQLAATQPDGSTLGQHLVAAVAAGMPADERLQRRAAVECGALWDAFVALDAARVPSMGVSPILSTELLAWQQLHGLRLTPWEVDTLQAMDRATLVLRSQRTGGH